MSELLPAGSAVYLVGGAVRDALLGLSGGDNDWVVVGSTPEAMLAAGFTQVGRDFPVFLHPTTHEEYALARTERKVGGGHLGFVCHAGPEVTLEDDLARRDLTINAIARTESGELVDPYGGAADIDRGVLRHVSPAFSEDPLRILRIARFAAQLGFECAPETALLVRDMAAAGALNELPAERVWQEFRKALAAPQPLHFIRLLERLDALAPWFEELAGVQQVFGDGALARYASLGCSLPFATIVALGERLRVPARYDRLARGAARDGTLLHDWPRQPAEQVYAALQRTGAVQRGATERQAELAELLTMLAAAHGSFDGATLQRVGRELAAVGAAQVERPGLTGKALGEAITQARVALLAAVQRDG